MATPLIAEEKFSIGYYSEWPTPNLLDVDSAELELELGMPVEWIRLSSALQMGIMIATEDIAVAYSASAEAFDALLADGVPYEAIETSAIYRARIDELMPWLFDKQA